MAYQSRLSGDLLSIIQTGIYQKIVIERKFQDKDFTAEKLADDLGGDKRYISATLGKMYNTKYNNFVYRHRVAFAVALLTDKQHHDMNVEDIGLMAGFASRQSFYNAFKKIMGMTPMKYRQQKTE